MDKKATVTPIRDCINIFNFGDSPFLFFLKIFLKSSYAPKLAKAIVTNIKAKECFDFRDKKKIEFIKMLIAIAIPPIDGTFAFELLSIISFLCVSDFL